MRTASRTPASPSTAQLATLPANDGRHHLHGGPNGFAWRLWHAEVRGANAVAFGLFSPDGDEGYTGNLVVNVVYTLRDATLQIDYWALTDRPTIVTSPITPTSNLRGRAMCWGIGSRRLPMRFCLLILELIPTGEVRSVAGTPFDFRRTRPIGAGIQAPDEQIQRAGGYDHTFCSARAGDACAAPAKSPNPKVGAPWKRGPPCPASSLHGQLSGRLHSWAFRHAYTRWSARIEPTTRPMRPIGSTSLRLCYARRPLPRHNPFPIRARLDLAHHAFQVVQTRLNIGMGSLRFSSYSSARQYLKSICLSARRNDPTYPDRPAQHRELCAVFDILQVNAVHALAEAAHRLYGVFARAQVVPRSRCTRQSSRADRASPLPPSEWCRSACWTSVIVNRNRDAELFTEPGEVAEAFWLRVGGDDFDAHRLCELEDATRRLLIGAEPHNAVGDHLSPRARDHLLSYSPTAARGEVGKCIGNASTHPAPAGACAPAPLKAETPQRVAPESPSETDDTVACLPSSEHKRFDSVGSTGFPARYDFWNRNGGYPCVSI